jgi:hypothetical protein
MSVARPDNGGSKVFWNAGKLTPDYTALQPRRQPSAYQPSWEPQILLIQKNNHMFTYCSALTFIDKVSWRTYCHHLSCCTYRHYYLLNALQDRLLLWHDCIACSIQFLKGFFRRGTHVNLLEHQRFENFFNVLFFRSLTRKALSRERCIACHAK